MDKNKEQKNIYIHNIQEVTRSHVVQLETPHLHCYVHRLSPALCQLRSRRGEQIEGFQGQKGCGQEQEA